MAGEQSQSEITRENFPYYFAIADEFGGSVHAFDVYQGPYIRVPGDNNPVKFHTLWIGPSEDTPEGYVVVYNETLDRKSKPFWPCMVKRDEKGAFVEAEDTNRANFINAAREALTPKSPNAKVWTILMSCTVSAYATVEVEAETEEEARQLADNADPVYKVDWDSSSDFQVLKINGEDVA